MDAKFILYYRDEDDEVYCFNHAVEKAKEGKQITLTGRDYSSDGNDMRTDPVCSVCEESASDVIDL